MICLDYQFGTFNSTCDSMPGSFKPLIAAQAARRSMSHGILGPFAPARKTRSTKQVMRHDGTMG
jgi:hypothetical protein